MHAITPLGRRYFPHIADICAGLVAVAARYTTLSPLLMLVWLRLRRTLTRLDRLAQRWQQGRLTPRPACPRPQTQRQPPQSLPADASHPRRTPQGHAWLIRLHQPLAQFAPRIQLLLDDPEVIALCTAAPQAGRLLRPLCRMFAITPPACIARPARVRPRKPRLPKSQPPPFAEHSPHVWPFVPHRLRLKVPGLRHRKPPD